MPEPSLVLYCLIRSRARPGAYLLMEKQGSPCFPATKLRPREDLYAALARPMEGDLGLTADSYYPEVELEAAPCEGASPRYQGLPKEWMLYPVCLSLTPDIRAPLERPDPRYFWWTPDEIAGRAVEPNVQAISRMLKEKELEIAAVPFEPSMNALACRWTAEHAGSVRVLRGGELRRILDSGSRAFNLRVADPYLPYQRQGLGFTWSFFTPKDGQDVHVHGMPAVEIYGVMEGRLQIWHKPMNQRGARAWSCDTAGPGDWVEIEPLQCHFACWLEPQGLGTVLKAAGEGELAGIGRLGAAGKTTCRDCSMKGVCAMPPALTELVREYALPYDRRNYDRIARVAGS